MLRGCITIKSCAKEDNLSDLRKVFELMHTDQLKMNLAKSFLGLPTGKFLEFVIASKGIHLNLEKVHVIQEM